MIRGASPTDGWLGPKGLTGWCSFKILRLKYMLGANCSRLVECEEDRGFQNMNNEVTTGLLVPQPTPNLRVTFKWLVLLMSNNNLLSLLWYGRFGSGWISSCWSDFCVRTLLFCFYTYTFGGWKCNANIVEDTCVFRKAMYSTFMTLVIQLVIQLACAYFSRFLYEIKPWTLHMIMIYCSENNNVLMHTSLNNLCQCTGCFFTMGLP